MVLYSNEYILTNAGGTVTVLPEEIADVTLLSMNGGSVTLAADYTLEYSALPDVGTSWQVIVSTGLDLNGNELFIYGVHYGAQRQIADTIWIFKFEVVDISGTPTLIFSDTPQSFGGTDPILYGRLLIDGSIDVDKLTSGTSAQMIVCNGSGIPTYVSVTGDVTISNAGVTALGAGVIVNADINASAAITRSKLASGTASHVVTNDGSGVLSSEAQLANTRGGTGVDTSASTGFPTVSSGTWSVGALTDTLRCDVSFVTAAQGTYYVRVPFACTVTAAKARVTSTISGTDDGTITLKDNSGTTMTSGAMTITASSAHGTGFTSSPSANNTFTANQEIQLTVAKTTSGGTCSVDLTITRTS